MRIDQIRQFPNSVSSRYARHLPPSLESIFLAKLVFSSKLSLSSSPHHLPRTAQVGCGHTHVCMYIHGCSVTPPLAIPPSDRFAASIVPASMCDVCCVLCGGVLPMPMLVPVPIGGGGGSGAPRADASCCESNPMCISVLVSVGVLGSCTSTA